MAARPVALVTGVAGQDGSYLAELLAARGYEVHGVVRTITTPVRTFAREVDVVLHEVDITEPTAFPQLLSDTTPDEIYHLAAVTSIPQSSVGIDNLVRTNCSASVRLLDATRAHDRRRGTQTRIMLCASAQVFGDAAQYPQTELTALRPTNPYAVSKAFVLSLARAARRDQWVNSVILYNHESPRRPPEFVTRKITHEVARIATGSSQGLELGNLAAVRDWGFAGDYVEAMHRAMVHHEPDEYVIATGTGRSVRDFVATAFAAAGVHEWEPYVSTSAEHLRAGDPGTLIGDASKARDVLGWQPSVGFDSLVEMMVRADLAAQPAYGTTLGIQVR